MTVGDYKEHRLADPGDLFEDFPAPRCAEYTITTDDGRTLYAWACKQMGEWTFDITETSCIAAFEALERRLAEFAEKGGDPPSIDDALPNGEMSLWSVPEEFGELMVEFVAGLGGEDDSLIRDQLYDVEFEKNPDGTLKATAGNLVWTRDSDGSWAGPAAYAVDYILDERADEAGFTDYGDD